ncbi:MAG: HypC/HybG/HupF family hydrogenase formation chaperone [Propionibacteriaceae bacterium]|jgi:hydrogenase maturation factor|nr:HypC/HybG/HupF family hydrogenase formation chaperone [Propionibacteriaceae bacterium]
MNCTEEVCITCSDEGRPARVVESPKSPFDPAIVSTDAGVEEVDVTLVSPVKPGDRVLIHAGTAIARLEGE